MGDLGCEPQIHESGRRNTATYAYDEFRETRKMSYCSRLKQTLLKFQLYYNFWLYWQDSDTHYLSF